ncbi:peptidylprolyl cis-trans isomerase, PpiC-type [Citrifermentans bemidjiense Bem]|uniref:Peptidylprolyl cis-trans isomerase, PpiC-type n=1 Tax=Citrifermentans bemidjiense (strain ATCC BAA-1014 / DSM 16622 / JCM 12645 / Bem) TaxID=404380 RepID=B5EGP3_CITBB|nr:peptidylprolyl isomerase [Citrifermentans bemidjiense]ACH39526.1 peptidylprolyl cis-trans isomerase, PpiC-type [Citrifermentans bemidjiense Bem]
MFSLKKKHLLVIASLLTAMLLPAGSFAEESAATPQEKPAGQPAAKKAANEPAAAQKSPAVVRVNGTPITKLDVERAVKVMLAQNKVDQPIPPELQKQAESAALEQLTSAELLYQEASKSKIPDLDKMIEQKVSQNRQKFKTEAELVEALSALEMTLPDLEEFTRKEIVLSTYIAEHFQNKASVSDEEVKKFYDDNLNQYFKKPESVKASHILVGTDEKSTPEDKKKAKEKAEALLKRLQAGEDFAAVAKGESTCPSASEGGDLGEFGRGQMVPEFEEAAFKLKPGEMSGVVETKFGYHIIKVTGKQEAAAEKLENVKETIVEFLKKQKEQQELSNFIDELKKKAKIEKVEL